MDNLLPTSTSFMKLARTMLIYNTFKSHPERKHQMVSCRDIGRAGALAFHHPEIWRERDFVLAGDEFTMPELVEIYREVSCCSTAPLAPTCCRTYRRQMLML